MKNLFISAVALSLLVATGTVSARGRQVCSGKKGGIAKCVGTKFLCKNGSVSKSKRSCTLR